MIILDNHEYYSVVSRVDKVKKEVKKEKNQKIDYRTIGWIRVQGTNIDLPILDFSSSYEYSDCLR